MQSTRDIFLSVLEGKKQERVLFTPRLDIWYDSNKARGTLPARYADSTLEEVRMDLGVDMSVRDGRIFDTIRENVDIKEETFPNMVRRHYLTPVGEVFEDLSIDPDSEKSGIKRHIITKHLIEKSEDYDIVGYIIDNTRYEPCFEEFLRYEETIGDRGYPLCVIGLIPMNEILLNLIGYNDAYYQITDNLEKVEHLNFRLENKMREMHSILLDSPARLFLHGAHFDTQMTPPGIFSRYFVPYYNRLIPELNRRGKYIAAHQDADASALLGLYLKAGINVADCFACSPLVKCTFEEAISVWGDRVVIWGGIPSTLLIPEECPEEEFEAHMKMILGNISKGRVILAVSDNVMPEADINRIRKIVDMIN